MVSLAEQQDALPECSGRCYALTESGAGHIDPECPKHGTQAVTPEGTLVDTGNFFVWMPAQPD